jgi:hypothetical protein
MSDSIRPLSWQCRNCDRPKIVGGLCATCMNAAYESALTALESSDRERQKLKADRLDLLAQLESIDQAAAKFYPGEKMLFGEATSRLVEDAGKWKAEIAKEQRDG